MGLIKIKGKIKDKNKEKKKNKIAVHPRLKKQDYIRVSQQVTTNINLPFSILASNPTVSI